MEWIKVVSDLSSPDEYSVAHLIGKTFQGELVTRERGYMVTDNGKQYFVMQDEVESAACAFCDDRAEENANVCLDCMIDGMEVSA